MPRFEVEFYEAVGGKQPAKDFLLSLDKKMRAKKYRTDYLSRKKEYKK